MGITYRSRFVDAWHQLDTWFDRALTAPTAASVAED
jgi:hypothetical protein